VFDCATNRIFEEANYKYVFRTTTMATRRNVAAARYIAGASPISKPSRGQYPTYAWGQDAWSDFTEAMKIIKPQVQIGTNVTPARRGPVRHRSFRSAGQRSRDRAELRCGRRP